jgi:hypothetical protein
MFSHIISTSSGTLVIELCHDEPINSNFCHDEPINRSGKRLFGTFGPSANASVGDDVDKDYTTTKIP